MARTCPSCGAEVVAHDAVHCHRCGARLATSDAAPSDASTDASTQAGTGDDWRTAAQDAGLGDDQPVIPNPRDPHGPRASGGPVSRDSNNWAMAAHLSAFLGAWIALAFVGPLLVWLVKRDQDPFVERHARQALNFNLLLLILVVLGFVGSLLTVGLGFFVFLPLLLIGALVWLILTILGAVKAANGEEYSYPFNISLVK